MPDNVIILPPGARNHTDLIQRLQHLRRIPKPGSTDIYSMAMLEMLLERRRIERPRLLAPAKRGQMIHPSVARIEYDGRAFTEAWLGLHRVVDDMVHLIVRPPEGSANHALLQADCTEVQAPADSYAICKQAIAEAVMANEFVDDRASQAWINNVFEKCKALHLAFRPEALRFAFLEVQSHAHDGEAKVGEPAFVPPAAPPDRIEPPATAALHSPPAPAPASAPAPAPAPAPVPTPVAPRVMPAALPFQPSRDDPRLLAVAQLRCDVMDPGTAHQAPDNKAQEHRTARRALLLDYLATDNLDIARCEESSAGDLPHILDGTFTTTWTLEQLATMVPGPLPTDPDIVLPSDPAQILEIVKAYREIRGGKAAKGITDAASRAVALLMLQSLEDLMCLGRTHFGERTAALRAGLPEGVAIDPPMLNSAVTAVQAAAGVHREAPYREL